MVFGRPIEQTRRISAASSRNDGQVHVVAASVGYAAGKVTLFASDRDDEGGPVGRVVEVEITAGIGPCRGGRHFAAFEHLAARLENGSLGAFQAVDTLLLIGGGRTFERSSGQRVGTWKSPDERGW